MQKMHFKSEMKKIPIQNREFRMIWAALNLMNLLECFWLWILLTIICKIQKSCGVQMLSLFSELLSYRRFLALSWYIRFDNGRTRKIRQRSDKTAPIRDVWNFLNENLVRNYEPHENITVDEQLFPYRGRTKFTQLIPSKPAKYEIEVW